MIPLAGPAVQVYIDAAQATAYVTIVSEGSRPTVQDVVEALRAGDVPYWIDEAAIVQGLQERILDQPIPVAFARDGAVSISIEKGEQEAFMVLEPAYGGKEVGIDDVEIAFAKKGVVLGIDREAVNRAFSEKIYSTPVSVARWKEPINGTDAAIEYLFKTEKTLHPKETEDRRIDYRELETVSSVTKGTVLARKIPATPGENGFTVTGKTLFTKPGKDVKLRGAKNTRLSEDSLEVIADIDGQPLLRDKVITVEHVLVIDGDMDFLVGNVTFDGCVKISGNVISGFSLKASESIQIDGLVEDAFIEAGGDIVIKGGMQGRKRGTIKAGGTVSLLFVEQGSVEAGANIIAGEALHSTLRAGDEVIVTKGDGHLCGGTIAAQNLIHANLIGSESGVRTELSVGFQPKEKARIEELRKENARREAALGEIEKGIGTLERYRQDNPGSWAVHKEAYERLTAAREELKERLGDLEEEIVLLGQRMSKAESPQVKVGRAIYPNVQVRIKDLLFENQSELTYTAFCEEEGRIQAKTYVV